MRSHLKATRLPVQICDDQDLTWSDTRLSCGRFTISQGLKVCKYLVYVGAVRKFKH